MKHYQRQGAQRTKRRMTRIAAGASLAMFELASAQTAPSTVSASAPPQALDMIVVTGQRASLRNALAAQQEADNIVSIVRADGIGKLPDANAAEALMRLPGVSVQRDQGEGRYISVRGLGSDFNTITINGAQVPSPEGSRRGIALDVLPAGLIRSLEVSKTLRPDMDANSLGGTVEIKTLSAFDLPGTFASVEGGVSYDGNTGQTSPRLAALFAGRLLEGKVGIAVGASADRRKFGSDNVETGGSWSGGKLSALELRDYRPNREREALALNLDYRPIAGQSYFLRAFDSRYSDEEVRDRLTISNIAGGGLAEGQTVSARAERRVRLRKFTQRIQSAVLGTEHAFEDWKVYLAAGASMASELTPESLNDGRFRGTANFAGVGFTDTERPRLIGPVSLYASASYALNDIRLQARDSEDRERHVRFDVTRQFELAGNDSELKFGAKTSRRKKTSDTEAWQYNSSNPADARYWGAGSTSLSAFVAGELDYKLGQIGAAIDPRLIVQRVTGLSRTSGRLPVDSVIADYSIHEDIDSAYLMGSTNVGDWMLLAGVRYEGTRFRGEGAKVTGSSSFAPLSADRSYKDWMPTVQARWSIDRETKVRAAWTNAVVRPVFSQIAPGINIISSTEATIGNPELAPLRASNFDVGIERALGRDGAVSVYAFTKDIENFSYATNLAGTGEWVNYTTATSYANGPRARLSGLELSYQQALRALPQPLNNLIVGANATFTQSTARINQFVKSANAVQGRDISFPGQSRRVLNFSLAYEDGPLSTRLAVNSKTPYLLELGDVLDSSKDRIVDRQTQLDFSFQYKITPKLQLNFEAGNLTNQASYTYQGSKPYNVQYELYGRTYKIGMKWQLF